MLCTGVQFLSNDSAIAIEPLRKSFGIQFSFGIHCTISLGSQYLTTLIFLVWGT